MSSPTENTGLPTSANPHDVHRVLINAQWIVRLRWVAVAGQLLTILVAQLLLGLQLPIGWLLLILMVTLVTNSAVFVWVQRQWLSVPDAGTLRRGQVILVAVMLLDVLSLTALLYLTGGTANPFCVFYLVNFALAAMVLTESWTWTVAAVGLLALATITLVSDPLGEGTESALRRAAAGSSPVRGSSGVSLLQAGMAIGVGLCGVVVIYFVRRLNSALARSDARRRQAEQQRARSERLEALGTLAAGAGHELNTPLSTIAVVSKELARELADRDELPDSVTEDVRLIRNEIDRCRHILNRLSLDSGRSAGEPLVEATVAQLVDEVLNDLPAADRVDVAVQPAASHRSVFVPLVGVAQALRGLVQNALDVTPGQQTVQLRGAIADGELHLQIEDHGPGMAPEVQSRAFEPFYTTKAPGEGMGLGLFLAQNTIQRLGGRIELTSTEGRGSLVDVWLPLV